MKDNKHIDRFFQERFKDFEATPDASVWDAIEDTLQHKKKKKRRVIPIWWRVAGLAAGILLLATLGTFVFNPEPSQTPTQNVVNTDDNTSEETKASTTENTGTLQKSDTEVIASEHTDTEENTTKNKEALEKDNASKLILNPGAGHQLTNTTPQKQLPLKSTAPTYKKAPATATASVKHAALNSKDEIKRNTLPSRESLDKVAQQTQNTSNSEQDAKVLNQIDAAKADALIKETQKNVSDAVTNQDINTTKTDITDENSSEIEAIEEAEKPSILDEIANASEEEKVAEEDPSRKKWNVMPNVAPVYFNTLGNGSSIHSQFKNNDKSGQINMSYGIAASYNVTDRLSVRSGVHKVNVGYDTNDVLIYQGIDSPIGNATGRSIETINYDANSEAITIVTATNLAFAEVPNVITNAIDASLNQNLGFIEVPLEIAYKVSDKKLGVSVIGGMSALFLSDNEVYSTLNGKKTLLGEANNVRNSSFTTNIGLGLDYKISEKFDINLEPVFKYHMNTFESKAGDFKPYTIGVYTGFSFKF